jgi:hypothetical protein
MSAAGSSSRNLHSTSSPTCASSGRKCSSTPQQPRMSSLSSGHPGRQRTMLDQGASSVTMAAVLESGRKGLSGRVYIPRLAGSLEFQVPQLRQSCRHASHPCPTEVKVRQLTSTGLARVCVQGAGECRVLGLPGFPFFQVGHPPDFGVAHVERPSSCASSMEKLHVKWTVSTFTSVRHDIP